MAGSLREQLAEKQAELETAKEQGEAAKALIEAQVQSLDHLAGIAASISIERGRGNDTSTLQEQYNAEYATLFPPAEPETEPETPSKSGKSKKAQKAA